VNRLSVHLALLLVLAGAACRREDAAAAARRTEKALLERQLRGMQELIDAASAGTLTKTGQIFIGIEDETIQQLVSAALPLDVVVANHFLVHLDSAQASFRASQSVITLRGRASPKGSPDTYVGIIVSGGLDRLEISEETGTLVGRVVADGLQVERVKAAGADRPGIQALIEGLGRTQLSAISEAMPKIEIPVRLDPEIKIGGFGDGPVKVAPGALPLKLSVARIVPVSGKLWVLLDADVGQWKRLPEEAAK